MGPAARSLAGCHENTDADSGYGEDATGWFQIENMTATLGWISADYVVAAKAIAGRLRAASLDYRKL